MNQVLRYNFSEAGRETMEADVALAIFAAECVYGRPRVRMEASYLVDEGGTTCVLDISGEAGEAVARVFAGLSTARVGDHAYSVRRLAQGPEPTGVTQ